MPQRNTKLNTERFYRTKDDFIKPPSGENPTSKSKQKELQLNIKLKYDHTILIKYFGKTFKRLAIPLIVIIIVFLLISVFHMHRSVKTFDPVPGNIRRQVNFNIYYPNPNKLPTGYKLNLNSFQSSNQIVLYTVSYGNGNRLIFTIQQKPSDSSLKTFYKVHLPLTIPIQTSVGDAALGALNNETVVSLPTNTNAWILMTAPLNANQSQLKQVIKSMTVAR